MSPWVVSCHSVLPAALSMVKWPSGEVTVMLSIIPLRPGFLLWTSVYTPLTRDSSSVTVGWPEPFPPRPRPPHWR